MNTRNPKNSSVIQMLLDAKTILEQESEPDVEALKSLNLLLKHFNSKGTIRDKIDKLFNAHKYGNVKWFKYALFDKKALLYTRPHVEIVIFELLCSYQSQTGNVTIIKQDIATILKLSDREKRNIQKYLDDLETLGFITAVKKPTNRKQPSIYNINPDIATIGTRAPFDDNKLQFYKSEYVVGKETVALDNDMRITSGKLVLRNDNDDMEETEGSKTEEPKKGVNALHNINTNTNNQDITNPETQHHYTNDDCGFASHLNYNMQNNDDLFTSAENKMFNFESDPNIPF